MINSVTYFAYVDIALDNIARVSQAMGSISF